LDRVEKLVSIGNGTYRVTLKDVTAGQWDVVVRAQSATHADFEAQRRVVLP
jgi:nitrogen fixation protein FixH